MGHIDLGQGQQSLIHMHYILSPVSEGDVEVLIDVNDLD